MKKLETVATVYIYILIKLIRNFVTTNGFFVMPKNVINLNQIAIIL